MPVYRKKSKYTVEQTQAITLEALDVLLESPIALNISEICVRSINLINQTPQKMARCLNELVEMGMVEKTKGKDGRMLYMAVAQLVNQGYRQNNNEEDEDNDEDVA